MKDDNLLYWIWLSERCGAASREFGKLIGRFENPFDIYRLDEDEAEHIEGIGSALKNRLCDKSLASAYEIMRYCKQNKVSIIPYGSDAYPVSLKQIEDPPVLLYCLGRMPDLNKRLCVGMVGTRKMSEYGKQSAYRISYELSAANAVVVSGMALGVDAVCACGAMEAEGTTVAVLGSGISVVYPREHEKLMHRIADRGAVLTEYAPTERPHSYHFPQRNRIISGLCQGVLVVEASAGSGALITAKRAMEQGREVFALPGKIDESKSDGPNELIRDGAHVALSADDIVRHYDFLYHDVINYRGLAQAKKKSELSEHTLEKYGVCVAAKGRDGGVSAAQTAFSEAISPTPAEHREQDLSRVPSGQINKQKKKSKNVEARSTAVSSGQPDDSERLLAELDETSRRVLAAMPIDRAVTPDAIAANGIGIGEVITSLTMLELSGLATSLPGGLYLRK